MSGAWRDDQMRETIPLEDIDILEAETTADLFSALPENPPNVLERTVARLPHQLVQEAPTRAKPAWDLTPPLGKGPTRQHPRAQEVYEETTAVRPSPEREERPWVDIHAVVDEQGRLRLPENVAKQLRKGAIVEVRLASWAVPDGA